MRLLVSVWRWAGRCARLIIGVPTVGEDHRYDTVVAVAGSVDRHGHVYTLAGLRAMADAQPEALYMDGNILRVRV